VDLEAVRAYTGSSSPETALVAALNTWMASVVRAAADAPAGLPGRVGRLECSGPQACGHQVVMRRVAGVPLRHM
jgi:hypothetical protein